MSNELWGLDAVTLIAGIRNGEFTTRDVITACLERIDATNPELNALTEVRPDAALVAADAADRAVAEGQPLPSATWLRAMKCWKLPASYRAKYGRPMEAAG